MSLLQNVRERYERIGRFEIEVPEWGCSLWFHPVPSAVFDKVVRNEKDELARNVRLLIECAEKEDGSKAFGFGDKAELMRIAEARVISRIVEQALNYEPPENDPGN